MITYKVIIVEDESGAADNLKLLLGETQHEFKIMAVLDTVEATVEWVKSHPEPDLAFFDIQLADGSSFEIFKQTDIIFPVIFTTAYSEFAIDAFKVNSIDYLLKPIVKNELEKAIEKFETLYMNSGKFDQEKIINVIQTLSHKQKPQYRKGFLASQGNKIIPLDIDSIAYFSLDNELVHAHTFRNSTYSLDESLKDIVNSVDPADFFRANRQFIVSRKAIICAERFFKGKLRLKLNIKSSDEILISKAKTAEFKIWLVDCAC